VTNWTSILNTSSIKKGRMPKTGEIVIDKKDVAKSLTNQPNSLIGKKITLTYTGLNKLGQKAVATVKVKVVGLTESSGTSQINAVGGSTIVDALKAVNMSTNVAALGVSAKSMNAAKSVAKRINEAKVNRKLRFTATAVSSILDRIETYISLITNVLAGIAGISLLVSALMIIVTMYMSVSDRTKEIGILRALGESKGDIRRLFTSESILLGIFSATFATIIALIVQTLANSALSKIAHYSFIQISAGNIISAFVISIIISLLAAILPARHAASLNPIDALAGE
jgi:macrolide export ATP-binding/permease protein macB 1